MDYVDSPFVCPYGGIAIYCNKWGKFKRKKKTTKLFWGLNIYVVLGHRFRIEYHLKAREDDLTLEAAENAKKLCLKSWLLKVLFDVY